MVEMVEMAPAESWWGRNFVVNLRYQIKTGPERGVFLLGNYRVFSSAGLEHHLDRVGVGGSTPPRLTELSLLF